MIQFTLTAQNSGMYLYTADGVDASVPYWFAYVSFNPGTPVPATTTLDVIWNQMALQSSTQPPGDFIFCRTAPTDPLTFLNNLEAYLATCRGTYAISYYVWVDDPAAAFTGGTGIQSLLSYALSSGAGRAPVIFDNKKTKNQLNFRNIYLGMPAGVGITLDTTTGIFSFSSQFACQPTQPQPTNCMVLHAVAGDSYMYGIQQTITLPLSGSGAFTLCFPFTMLVNGGILQNDLNTLDTSIKYFYTDSTSGLLMQNSYPVFGLPADNSTRITFNVTLDPLYPLNTSRSCFLFPTSPSIVSGFTTDMGHDIIMTADGTTGSLVFASEMIWSSITKTQIASYYLAPMGNFNLSLRANDLTTAPKLMCGLSATEGLGFVPAGAGYAGDLLAFYPNQDAYANVYPLPANDGTQPPIAAADLLNNTYMTSWINVLTSLTPPQKNNYYYSQPPASSLYAAGTGGQSDAFLWFFEPPSRDLSSGGNSFCFPAAPYSTITPSADPDNFSASTINSFENQVLFPVRKNLLSASATSGNLKRKAAPSALTAGLTDTTTTATTPQGLLATVGTQGEYLTVQLAYNTDQGVPYTLQLENVTPQLTDALQTNQLFMVATSGTNIGTLWSPPQSQPSGQQAAFENFMSIEEWPFVLNVGKGCSYGNYANVLLFKFCPGKIVDLAAHPEQWTQSYDFINAGEVQAASGWLQTYLNDSIEQYNLEMLQSSTSFYTNFNNIINDAEWNGILCLKVDISLTSFPKQLQGLLGGIDLSKFNAHHFGININQVTNSGGLQMQPFSSMFGLIDYEDPAYVLQQQQDPGCKAPVQPQQGQVYDFKVLKLQVLFENTAVADFSSIVQVTMNQLFGDNVTLPGTEDYPSYNSVVLNGTYQDYDNNPVYVFDSDSVNPFSTDTNVLTEVEMVKVQFNTLVNQANTDANMVNSRFSMWGYLYFAELPGSMDAFSYGYQDTGLNFSNLYIDMSFDVRTPSAKTMLFDSAQIAFDTQQSAYRPDSLCAMFPLTLTGLVSGNSTSTPATMNYLKVGTPNVTSSALGNSWNGLLFTLNMGTPGALASEMGFSSSFLMAWGSGSKGSSTFKISLGIQLPGTAGIGNLMGIEGVLKLAIDTIQLSYAPATDSSPAGYLLMLNNIALKFLGILQLPPGGSTNCYVFGSPGTSGNGNNLAWYAVYVGANGPTGDGTSAEPEQTGIQLLES